MIPKVIHYCWFGGNPLPDSVRKCINSWKKFCPDYDIKQWDETNINLHENAYVLEAYQAKKWNIHGYGCGSAETDRCVFKQSCLFGI